MGCRNGEQEENRVKESKVEKRFVKEKQELEKAHQTRADEIRREYREKRKGTRIPPM